MSKKRKKKKRKRIYAKTPGIFRSLMIGLAVCAALLAGPVLVQRLPAASVWTAGPEIPSDLQPIRALEAVQDFTGEAAVRLSDAQSSIRQIGFLDGLSDVWGNLLGWLGLSGDRTWDPKPSPLSEIPSFEGEPYVVLNGNDPGFSAEECSRSPYEAYGALDLLGRCTVAEAMISYELMPTASREGIGMIQPTGWHTVKYDIIEDRYLYNRCHLIGYQLTGENANEKNLITGTRYMNVTGMLPWENMVAEYIRRTGDRVLYRATPVFKGLELVARGVHLQAQSVSTDEISFNIFIFNIQPGIGIDYGTGRSWEEAS